MRKPIMSPVCDTSAVQRVFQQQWNMPWQNALAADCSSSSTSMLRNSSRRGSRKRSSSSRGLMTNIFCNIFCNGQVNYSNNCGTESPASKVHQQRVSLRVAALLVCNSIRQPQYCGAAA